jgi:hypothetical protein
MKCFHIATALHEIACGERYSISEKPHYIRILLTSGNDKVLNQTNITKPFSRFRVLLERLIVAQIVKNFIAFHGNSKFITTFIKSHHCIIS